MSERKIAAILDDEQIIDQLKTIVAPSPHEIVAIATEPGEAFGLLNHIAFDRLPTDVLVIPRRPTDIIEAIGILGITCALVTVPHRSTAILSSAGLAQIPQVEPKPLPVDLRNPHLEVRVSAWNFWQNPEDFIAFVDNLET